MSSQKTRDRIIRAASECVSQFGAAKTSLDDVSARAGVHRQTIYLQFGNREELFKAVMQDRLERMVEHVRLKIDANASLKKAVIVGTMATLALVREDSSLMAILHEMHNVSVDSQLISAQTNISELFSAIWQPLFERAKRSGEISKSRTFKEFSQWLRGAQYIVLLREELTPGEQEQLLRVFIDPGFSR